MPAGRRARWNSNSLSSISFSNSGQGMSLPGSVGAHLWIVGVQEQHSGNILVGSQNVLQELSALGRVQVVLGLLRVVLDGC